MTIREALNLGNSKLSKSTSSSPTLDAEVLLSHLLDKPKEYLLTNPDKQLTLPQEKQFKILLSRRVSGWPVPYITNTKEFFGLKFYVDKNVLIPRPETEGLVELVSNRIQDSRFEIPRLRRGFGGQADSLSILDIGTGSGAIIISLAKLLSSPFSLFASDVSKSALAIAKKNAKLHRAKITFKQGSLLEPWKKQQFDIIVANLPYLKKETDLSTKFEPKQSLIARKKGLALYEKLLKQTSKLLPSPRPNDSSVGRAFCLFLEIGHDQGQPIKNLAKKYLPDYETKISKDLFGRNRYAVLVRKSS